MPNLLHIFMDSGMTTTTYFKEYKNDGRIYLLLVDAEKGKPMSGFCFLVRPSLLRPQAGIQPIVSPQDFPPDMSFIIDRGARDGTTAYLLRSPLHDESASITTFPLLGRKIIAGLVRVGSYNLKIFGEFSYIPRYWEWTEDILSHYGDILTTCSIYEAVHASLYTYDRDPNILRAFCESWCPTTNTLHTMAGEVSISLWDLYRISGLPISGVIYDETIPSCTTLQGKDQHGYRLISRACEHLFVAYSRLEKKSQAGVSAEQWINFWCKKKPFYKAPPRRRRHLDSSPRFTHNPSGNLMSRSREWTTQELEIFSELGITEERVRDKTYLAAFLSCWLCVFVLPKTEDRLIRPSTFEIATHMASQTKFSLAIPVLSCLYRGLNGIVNSPKPAYSGYCFPAHYLYMWIAHYFGTHYAADPCPPGPLGVRYSGARGAKWMKDDEARKLIHEGESINWGCMMFNKNRKDTLLDDGTLESPRLDYLIALRSGYLPFRRRDSFHIEPYSPHRFSRQFGFCQGNPGKIVDDDHARIVPYNKALRYWKLLLCEGSQSKVVLPNHTSELSQYVTTQYHDWWTKVNVNDLRDKIDILKKGVESDPSKLWRNKKFKTLKEAFAESLDLNKEGFGDTSNVHMTTKRDASTIQKTEMNNVVGVESNNNKKDSKANFNNRGGKRRSPTTTVEEDPKTIYGSNLFEDMWSSSNLPKDPALIGLFDADQNMSHINKALHGKSNHDLQTSTLEPEEENNYNVVKQLAPMDNSRNIYEEDKEIACSFPAQKQHSTAEPHCLDIIAQSTTDDASQNASNIVPYPLQNDFATSTSFTSFEPGPLSKNIFAEAIRDIGAKYLTSLKEAPFSEVEKRYKEADMVYKGIEKLRGDPTPLKSKVDSYVASVKSYMALERVASKRKRQDELKKEIVKHTAKVTQAESNLNDARTNYNILAKKYLEVEVKIAILEVELRDAREKKLKLKSGLETMGSLVTQAETQLARTKQALTKVETSEILSPEEVAKLEQHRKNVLELQSTLKPLEWMDIE